MRSITARLSALESRTKTAQLTFGEFWRRLTAEQLQEWRQYMLAKISGELPAPVSFDRLIPELTPDEKREAEAIRARLLAHISRRTLAAQLLGETETDGGYG